MALAALRRLISTYTCDRGVRQRMFSLALSPSRKTVTLRRTRLYNIQTGDKLAAFAQYIQLSVRASLSAPILKRSHSALTVRRLSSVREHPSGAHLTSGYTCILPSSYEGQYQADPA